MRFSPQIRTLLKSGATIVIASAFVVGAVIAATTIGSNYYSTGGALFNQASTTAVQVQNGSGTQVFNVDSTNLGVKVTGAATTTLYHWLGTGGTADNLNYTGGELYVQDAIEVDGIAYLSTATSTSATSTAYLYVGPTFTTPGTFNYTGGDLAVAGESAFSGLMTLSSNVYSAGGALLDKASTTAFQVQNGSGTQVLNVDTTNTGLKVTGAATSTLYIWAGAGGTANFLDYTGGDVYVQDDLEVDGSTYMVTASTSGTFVSGGVLTVATTSATTTGQAVIGAPAGTATSTLVIGHPEKPDGCLELWENGVAYRTYINGGSLVTEAGRCKD